MSDQEPIPPLPPDPQTPPPVLPHAQVEAQRPGIVTALGVTSTIIGGLAALINACGISQSVMYIVMSRVSAQVMVAGPTTVPANPFAQMPVFPFVLNGIGQMIGLALAVYLLVCGILVLRDRVSGRRHHLRYAILKFIVAAPVAAVEGWSTYAMQRTIMSSIPQGAGLPNSTFLLWVAVGMAVFWFIVAIAYPVAVMITMHLQQVRRYYAELQEAGSY